MREWSSGQLPYAVIISTGVNAFEIEQVSSASVIFCTTGIYPSANGNATRFYFQVPEDRREFTFELQGHAAETATYTLFDPDGQVVKQWPNLTRSVTHVAAVNRPGIWSIEVDEAVDDAGFRLIDLPNVFALTPEDVMVLRPDDEQGKQR